MLNMFLTHYSFLSAHLSFLFTLKLTHSALLSSTPYLGDGSYLPSYLYPFTVLPISSYLHIFISSHPTQHPHRTTPTSSIVNKLTFRHTYLNLNLEINRVAKWRRCHNDEHRQKLSLYLFYCAFSVMSPENDQICRRGGQLHQLKSVKPHALLVTKIDMKIERDANSGLERKWLGYSSMWMQRWLVRLMNSSQVKMLITHYIAGLNIVGIRSWDFLVGRF